jgi:hypothetical protein
MPICGTYSLNSATFIVRFVLSSLKIDDIEARDGNRSPCIYVGKNIPAWLVHCTATFVSAFTLGAKVVEPMQFRWMYSQERELKKLRIIVRNEARVKGCIAKAFACKEIMNFSSKYFSRTNNVNAHTTWYHIIEVLLSELSIFHAPAWGQRRSKLPQLVPLTCNLSRHPFFISDSHSSITCI